MLELVGLSILVLKIAANDRDFTVKMIARIYMWVGLITFIISVIALDITLPSRGEFEQFTTVAFLGALCGLLIILHAVEIFASRSSRFRHLSDYIKWNAFLSIQNVLLIVGRSILATVICLVLFHIFIPKIYGYDVYTAYIFENLSVFFSIPVTLSIILSSVAVYSSKPKVT